MTTLENLFNELATEVPTFATNFQRKSSQPPLKISQPIDCGALKLLANQENAYLTYNPLEVEYLIQTLNEHIANCLELRMKAQDLEARAFIEVNDQRLQRKLLEALENQAEIVAANEPKILANTINTKLTDGEFKGDTSASYWSDMLEVQKLQLQQRIENADKRLSIIGEEGSGMNFIARFEFLKKLFDIDFFEGYCRARAACIGLKEVYGIDVPLPPVTDIGYLNELTIWARGATYKLEKHLFKVREATFAYALVGNEKNQLFTKEAFRTAKNNGVFSFEIENNFFEHLNIRLKNLVLRGIDIHATAQYDFHPQIFWRVSVELPLQNIPVATDASYEYIPKIFLPMVTYPSQIDKAVEISTQKEVYNVKPIGSWVIRIEPQTIGADQPITNDAAIDNLVVRLRIAYEKD